MLLDFAEDVRTSVRGLLRAPVLTLTILATVGLGIAVIGSYVVIAPRPASRP